MELCTHMKAAFPWCKNDWKSWRIALRRQMRIWSHLALSKRTEDPQSLKIIFKESEIHISLHRMKQTNCHVFPYFMQEMNCCRKCFHSIIIRYLNGKFVFGVFHSCWYFLIRWEKKEVMRWIIEKGAVRTWGSKRKCKPLVGNFYIFSYFPFRVALLLTTSQSAQAWTPVSNKLDSNSFHTKLIFSFASFSTSQSAQAWTQVSKLDSNSFHTTISFLLLIIT